MPNDRVWLSSTLQSLVSTIQSVVLTGDVYEEQYKRTYGVFRLPESRE